MAAGGDAIHEMGVRIDEVGERMQVDREREVNDDGEEEEEEEEDYDEASLLELLAHIDREAGSAEAANGSSRNRYRPGEGGFSDFPDFMRDPVIR